MATEIVIAVGAPWREFEGHPFICGEDGCATFEPDECDCGYVGDWQWRMLYRWFDQPGHCRRDEFIRRDMAIGLPGRPRDEGWWVLAGWEERCPGCGDIERLDAGRNIIEVEINDVGKRRRAAALRRNADLLEQATELRVRAHEIERGTVPAERVRIVDETSVRLSDGAK